MATKTVVKALSDYFNQPVFGSDGDEIVAPNGQGAKRPVGQWSKELKEFSTDEKAALAAEVCAATGDTLA